MEQLQWDVIIIGAGPIGLACGIEAKKAGLNYVIIEKGCLVNSIYNYPRNMTFFSTSERLEIGEVPFISHLPKPTRPEALEYYRRVAASWKLQVRLYEPVITLERAGAEFHVRTEKAEYQAKNLVIATGFFDHPYLMNVEGEDLPKVKHYYDEPHPYYGQKVIVVGAANSAVDVALETYRKGAEVTMVVREPELSTSVKYWARPDIDNRIQEGAIKAYFNSTISRIAPTEVAINTPEGSVTIPNDWVLAMTGYKPDFALLEAVGVAFGEDVDRTPHYDPATHQSNIPGVYLAGVVCGGLRTNKWFIENSREHAPLIITAIQERLKARTT